MQVTVLNRRLPCLATALLIPLACVFGNTTHAQSADLGIFTDHQNVGNVRRAGAASYNPANGTYTVSGGGENIWGKEDQFYFVWKKMKGDFTLRCRCRFAVGGGDRFRKIGWMIRKDLDTDSAYVDAAYHGRGLTSLQYRRTKGGKTKQIESKQLAPEVVQLARKGDSYTMSVAKFGKPFVVSTLEKVELGDDVYVGLFVCAHDKKEVEKASFSNVRIVRPTTKNMVSRLEVMDVRYGKRVIVRESNEPIRSPMWTKDGNYLVFSEGEQLHALKLKSNVVTKIKSGAANRFTGDHVMSADGKTIGFSHLGGDGGDQAAIYTMPVAGGEPKRITNNVPSYIHGWSPDGTKIVFTGRRENNYDVFAISSSGGEEVRLTDSEGIDDGAEYSNDGKQIYFNSNRNGQMEIWRMNADGSDQTQLTDDEFNNWFPHVAPDGKTIVFLSYPRDVDSSKLDTHRSVYLRQLSTKAGKPKVIAFLNGGLGSINVNSWSPDGKKIAFVSYSGTEE